MGLTQPQRSYMGFSFCLFSMPPWISARDKTIKQSIYFHQFASWHFLGLDERRPRPKFIRPSYPKTTFFA